MAASMLPTSVHTHKEPSRSTVRCASDSPLISDENLSWKLERTVLALISDR